MTQNFIGKVFLFSVFRIGKINLQREQLRAFVFLTLSLFFISPSQGKTLKEALALAYTNNPVLQSVRAQLRSADEGVATAISAWRPTIRLSASSGLNVTNSEAMRIERYSKTYPTSVTLVVEESLYEGGKKFAALEKAEMEIKVQRAILVETEQNLLLSAAQAYVDVVRDIAILDLSMNNENLLRSQLLAIEERFQVGEETLTDVAQSRSRLAQVVSMRVQAEGNLSISQATYKRIIGQLPQGVNYQVDLPDLPPSLETAQQEALKNNPLVIRRRFAEKVAEQAIEELEATLLPSFSVRGEASASFTSGKTDSKRQDLSLVGKLVVPIYQTGAEYSRIRRAKQVLQQRRGEWEQSQRLAIEYSTRAWESLMSRRAQIEALKTSVKSSEVALEGVRQEKQVGSRTTLDVLNAEQELLDTKISLFSAERDELVARFELLQATGQLTAETLGLDTELYDPMGHYDDVRGKWIGLGSNE